VVFLVIVILLFLSLIGLGLVNTIHGAICSFLFHLGSPLVLFLECLMILVQVHDTFNSLNNSLSDEFWCLLFAVDKDGIVLAHADSFIVEFIEAHVVLIESCVLLFSLLCQLIDNLLLLVLAFLLPLVGSLVLGVHLDISIHVDV